MPDGQAELLAQIPLSWRVRPWLAVVLGPVFGLAALSDHDDLEITRRTTVALDESWHSDRVNRAEDRCVVPQSTRLVVVNVPQVAIAGPIDEFEVAVKRAL